MVVKNASSNRTPEKSFRPFQLNGTIEDIFASIPQISPIYKNWCNRQDIHFGYVARNPLQNQSVDQIMESVRQKFQSSRMSMTIHKIQDEPELLNVLKNDLLHGTRGCSINQYVGGVVFEDLDISQKSLKYRLLLPEGTGKDWKLDEMWQFPYGGESNVYNVPVSPPYWPSGFLSLQHSIETSFVENSGGSSDKSGIVFQALPEPVYQSSSISAFISIFPTLFAFVTYINVVHVSREIAAENGSVKPFLTAMGLSSFMFYLTHILVAFGKFFVILLVTAIPLSSVMQFANPLTLFFAIFFYGLGALTFGALIASFFTNTNSAIKTTIISWGIMLVLSYMFKPPTEHISQCFLYGLNINGAFKLAIEAISDYMKRERNLSIFNMFNDSSFNFSLGFSILLMIFDILWMFGLTLLIDFVRNSADFSISSLFSKKNEGDYTECDGITLQNTRNNEQMSQLGQSSSLQPPNIDSDALLEGSNEIDGARNSAKAGISVKKLVKVWSSTGERAVDGLSFEAKQGQVSILLGHNGAGKSTTFASIAGIIKPTQGRILICDEEIEINRQNIGLCPQYNPLYERLTVEEHLWLVNGLKGNETGEKFNMEMKRLLDDVKLEQKKNEFAMNLSGGMKRKLCVCMALIGSSEVVLLDEPTAGMDPGARKDIQDLLEREKKDRTILLTTHYMDEAERLGDWILIMSHGKLVSSGTTKFLKQKYGTGYLLTVVLNQNQRDVKKSQISQILEEVSQFYIPNSTIGEHHGQQIEIILPVNQKTHFKPLFKALEAIQRREFTNEIFSQMPNSLKQNLANLDLSSFGLQMNTLEQVFITIGDKVEQAIISRQNSQASRAGSLAENAVNVSLKPPGYDTQSSTKSSDSYMRLMESQQNGPERQGFSKVLPQILAIFRKKALYSWRNKSNFIGQVAVPIVLLGLVASLSNYTGAAKEGGRVLGLEQLLPTRVIWKYDSEAENPFALKMKQILENTSPGFIIQNYPKNQQLLNITQNLIGEMPAAGFGFYEDVTLFNIRDYHIVPALVSLNNKARLWTGSGSRSEDIPRIETGIFLYSNETSKILSPTSINILLSPLLILIFALVTSSFVMFLIEERVSKFGHQQFLTGISPGTFYGASFLFDFAVFSVICLIFLVMFVIWQWMIQHLAIVIMFWFLYFFSCVPFIYAVSSIFESPSKANVLLVIWQVVISGAAMIFTLVLKFLINLDESLVDFIQNLCLFFLPSYAFGTAIVTINSIGLLDQINLLDWDILGKNAVFMALFGISASILFVILQFKVVRKTLSQILSIRKANCNNVEPIYDELPRCDGVEIEKEKVKNANPSEYALLVRDLSKQFGRFTAVNQLNLAVDQKECFGLLGINGAGKTTTFNILTGQSFATNGEAMIGGKDVTEQIAIGYCPQFDALLLDLTGREILEILGQMHGFKKYQEKAELVLECVGMRQNADKLCRYYSGGQKRKISVGIALLSPTQMIILDEPTAGIDPKARREIWELLIWTRQNSNSALMLTSHSMDECEALCSRIAVLNRGKLIAIGTSQELKSLYGNSYTMTLTLNDVNDREFVTNKVAQEIPNSILKTPETNKTVNLVWQIPKNPSDQWSEKFEQVQILAKKLNVKDYILSQSSLEETFLRLAGINNSSTQTQNYYSL
ncbi:unnamed protein product [Caenorhabditis angaria]|uniref:ABC transporter domain-containing protein n=1 Tax=Caenorhabditis angaria TaxID=860376 RepID=A0A9P1MZC8_9PELO|nr:unnamed protein product [Caenorhabditis angaria]